MGIGKLEPLKEVKLQLVVSRIVGGFFSPRLFILVRAAEEKDVQYPDKEASVKSHYQ